MRWFPRARPFRSPEQQADDRVSDLLLQLFAEYEFMVEQGWQFRPSARLARKALAAIHWLTPGCGSER